MAYMNTSHFKNLGCVPTTHIGKNVTHIVTGAQRTKGTKVGPKEQN